MPNTTLFSLRKCRHILREGILRYKKLQKRLSPPLNHALEKELENLEVAITAKDQVVATKEAKELLSFLKTVGKKSSFDHIKEFLIAILFAVLVAAFVRQMWFELYEIPTGSMRPTFREHDRVLVSKNSFGINTPFQTSHLEFNPELIKRGNFIVFSGDGIPLPDVDTTYFLLFPGKKRYVKRCMGKPGDTLYFYGGALYGLDKDGNELKDMLTDPTFSQIEHIPFLNFEGNKTYQKVNPETGQSEIVIIHMDIPLARISANSRGNISSEFFNGKEWIKPDANSLAFANLWGMRNYAQSRIIDAKDLPKEAQESGSAHENATLYLELKHTPTLPIGSLPSYEKENYTSPSPLQTRTTWLHLDAAHIKAIRNALYTSRFIVHNGTAYRYSQDAEQNRGQGVTLAKGIPNGTYEFFDGLAYQIGWGDISYLLPPEHPIYPKTDTLLKALYNSGIELSEITNPTPTLGYTRSRKPVAYFPARYAYFRKGDLYLMGAPVFKNSDPILTDLASLEIARAHHNSNYIAFADKGAPLLADGSFNKEFIKDNGLKIPEGHYLALGDNHAMSLDSRYFGFVPQNNLQGSPLAIFWPPGSRFGRPPQPEISFWRIENAYVLTAAAIIAYISYYLFRRSTSPTTYRRLKQKRLKRDAERDKLGV